MNEQPQMYCGTESYNKRMERAIHAQFTAHHFADVLISLISLHNNVKKVAYCRKTCKCINSISYTATVESRVAKKNLQNEEKNDSMILDENLWNKLKEL